MYFCSSYCCRCYQCDDVECKRASERCLNITVKIETFDDSANTVDKRERSAIAAVIDEDEL